MAATPTEAWIEITLVPNVSPDTDLLLLVIDPLVHGKLAGEIESWHYFWEPALQVRVRWVHASRRTGLDDRLGTYLDKKRDEGYFKEWYESNHGTRGERHEGEPERYGPEAWDLIQKDWMNGSELALRLLRLERENRLTGELTPTLDAHWSRHVHLFTNELFGTSEGPTWWDSEIRLCLQHARGYLANSVVARPSERYVRMLALVNEALRS